MTGPKQTSVEHGWTACQCHKANRGPISLTVSETADPEIPWRWVAEYGLIKRSEGTAEDVGSAKRRAERAAVLLWLLFALETGEQPEGFLEAHAWLSELKSSLDFERYCWGVWKVEKPRDGRTEDAP